MFWGIHEVRHNVWVFLLFCFTVRGLIGWAGLNNTYHIRYVQHFPINYHQAENFIYVQNLLVDNATMNDTTWNVST